MSKKKEKPCFMEDIYRKHERLMYYIAGKYSEVSVQREDIVQTAVLSLLKNEATLQRLPPYAQINYIAAAVRNTAINTIKRDQKEAARCIPLDDLTEDFPQAHIPGAEVRYLEKEKQEELLTAFQEIREEERQLLSTVTIDTEDAEVREENLDDQGVSIVHKDSFYQIYWLEDTSNLMFVVYGENISLDVLQSVAERIIHA